MLFLCVYSGVLSLDSSLYGKAKRNIDQQLTHVLVHNLALLFYVPVTVSVILC